MRLQSYLQSAKHMLDAYNGELPLSAWLKNHFKQNKKYGSRDRRLIADLCFCYYRLGKMQNRSSMEEQLLAGQFLCHKDSPFIPELKPGWERVMSADAGDKLAFLGETMLPFPFTGELSPAIEKEPFSLSFLQQPDLFLRVRPGKESIVGAKLRAAGSLFQQEGSCIRLANNTRADEIIRLDEEAVVQDLSSQQVLQPLVEHLQTLNAKPPTTAWDCCAASGGKSILLHDLLPAAMLTVSDIRESILANLRNRFKRAGIQRYHSFVANVASPQFSLAAPFDLIICDAPCSGSGTWSRTPEQMFFFKPEKIEHYVSLQKNIALNASRHLKKGGFFLYITCSVFFRENEDVVGFLLQNSQLNLVSQQFFKGYEKKADTLFAALFTI